VTPTPLLEARGLGRQVEGRWLWRNLDLRLAREDVGILVGPSGAGKSLLFRTLCGLDLPDEGEVLVGGTPLPQLDRPAVRARVLLLSQDPVIVPGSVRRNLEIPFQLGAHAARDFPDEEFLHHQLRQLRKTPDFLERSHEVLSGGEAQIVAFLRVLFLDPDVLLLDEPTANLDPESAAAVEKVMRRWVAGPNRAILWSSHDPAQAERMRHGPRLELGGGA